MQKDPARRLRDIGDAFTLLDASFTGAGSKPRRNSIPWALTALAILAAGIFSYLWLHASPLELLASQFEVNPPGNAQFTNIYAATAASPDGRYLIFGAGTPDHTALWLRPLDSLSARLLQGTEGANLPFWSPDNKSIAFYQNSKLMRSDIVGGAPQVLCDAKMGGAAGGTWNRDGIILFATRDGILRVASSGGVPQTVLEPNKERKEDEVGNPQFLPGGRRFLYVIHSSDPNTQGVYAGSLDDPKERVRVVAAERKAFYVPPSAGQRGELGYLLWMRGQTLLAQSFDVQKLSLMGDPAPVVEDVARFRHPPGRRSGRVTPACSPIMLTLRRARREDCSG